MALVIRQLRSGAAQSHPRDGYKSPGYERQLQGIICEKTRPRLIEPKSQDKVDNGINPILPKGLTQSGTGGNKAVEIQDHVTLMLHSGNAKLCTNSRT